ncbi:MAG: outer membrane protein assembly factor BamD [Pseudomonadales bacterium]
MMYCRYYQRFAALLCLCLLLSACSSTEDKVNSDASEKQLYDIAQRQLESQNYSSAIQNLQLLESRYPFGPFAEQAQLEIIYAYYRGFELESAIAAADRFIRLHPHHPSVDYAYYLKGLARYAEGQGFLDRFLPTDLTQRDPGPARDSFNDFAQLLARFPDSEYVPDAKARMVHLRNLLSRYEIHVANYYFKRRAYQAAANRGRYVLENYQQTTAVPDALAVMVQAYQLLGLQELADDSLRVLASNYPEHPALNKDGSFKTNFNPENQDRSMVNMLTFGLFDRNEPLTFDYRP